MDVVGDLKGVSFWAVMVGSGCQWLKALTDQQPRILRSVLGASRVPRHVGRTQWLTSVGVWLVKECGILFLRCINLGPSDRGTIKRVTVEMSLVQFFVMNPMGKEVVTVLCAKTWESWRPGALAGECWTWTLAAGATWVTWTLPKDFKFTSLLCY
jgi:hypothetical protein